MYMYIYIYIYIYIQYMVLSTHILQSRIPKRTPAPVAAKPLTSAATLGWFVARPCHGSLVKVHSPFEMNNSVYIYTYNQWEFQDPKMEVR